MKSRKPLISTVFLITVGLMLGFYLGFSGVVSSGETQAIEYSYIYSTTRTDVAKAEWKIVFYVVNRGSAPLRLTNVYVDEREVDVYGLVHGESLDSASQIGTSIPQNGLTLNAGEGIEVFIWIGGNLYPPGTELSISLNPIEGVNKHCSVTIYASTTPKVIMHPQSLFTS